MAKEQLKERIGISTNTGVEFVNVDSILRCESSKRKTIFILDNDAEVVSNTTMKKVEAFLSKFNFYRVHNSHLINLNKVKEYNSKKPDQLLLLNGATINISNRKKQNFLEQFTII